MQWIKRKLISLFNELWPPTLFFFVALLLIAMMFKLLVERYAVVEFSAFAKAAVGALILAKAIGVVDWAGSGYGADLTHRRIVVITVKTLMYALVVLVFGLGEKLFAAYHKTDSLVDAASKLIANVNVHRFL